MMAYAPVIRTRFRALIEERYQKAHLMSASVALTLVSVRSGVSLGALWTAYRGFRIAADTAVRLREWAYHEHGVEDFDVEHLVTAPHRPRRGPTRGRR
jgi:hypothetical protein